MTFWMSCLRGMKPLWTSQADLVRTLLHEKFKAPTYYFVVRVFKVQGTGVAGFSEYVFIVSARFCIEVFGQKDSKRVVPIIVKFPPC